MKVLHDALQIRGQRCEYGVSLDSERFDTVVGFHLE